MSKVVKKVSGVVLPQLGVVGGAANGLIQGQGLSGALKGGLQGGVNAIASIAGQSLGSSLLGNGFSIPGLGSVGGSLGAGGMGPPTPGTGILGTVGKVFGAGSGGGSSLFSGNTLGNILSGVNSYNTNDDNEKVLLKAQKRAEEALLPYQQQGTGASSSLGARLSAGFDPNSVSSDPSFQFNLQQGNQALDRAAAARGGFYSGAALKEAQDFGQNLANTYSNDYFNRWSNTNNQLQGLANSGLSAAGKLTDVYDNQGNIKANQNTANSNIINSSLSQILSGSGRQIIGYDSTGKPIYADDKTASAV